MSNFSSCCLNLLNKKIKSNLSSIFALCGYIPSYIFASSIFEFSSACRIFIYLIKSLTIKEIILYFSFIFFITFSFKLVSYNLVNNFFIKIRLCMTELCFSFDFILLNNKSIK